MSSRSTSPTATTLVPWPSQLCGTSKASAFDMQAYLILLRQQRSKAAAQMPAARVQKSAEKRPAALRRSQRLRRAQKAP